MRKIWSLVRYDAKHVFTNVISLVVCVGMIVVPCFYAWFNIAASWDPYGNTSNLKVAVANADSGYTSELIPVSVNMGERMETELRKSDSIGYTVTSEDDAVEGVRSGKYYAAIVFPENFTRDLLSGFANSASAPKVTFYQNDKESAIGKIVTSKASTAVQQDIDESFAQALTTGPHRDGRHGPQLPGASRLHPAAAGERHRRLHGHAVRHARRRQRPSSDGRRRSRSRDLGRRHRGLREQGAVAGRLGPRRRQRPDRPRV